MTTANLLNLNVDTLFEQHSVPEIDIIQKKIQAVVENKREELRTMVGERYRDLLQAADTIASMQTSAGTLITQVEQITTNCRILNDQQLIGFKNNDTTELIRQRNANKELNNYFSTMVQIKLLTSLPEMIWSQIDQEHFYAATELFIFSRHISTGLQLDANNELMKHLPVAKKQWEILKPFHMTIKQSVLAVLEREDLTAEVVADCLHSLLLLEKSSFNSVIKTFLQLRCSTFLTCLSESTYNADVELRRVKERILASLKILNDTMSFVNKCLLTNGLLFRKLAEYTNAEALPTISSTDEAQYAHLLPEIIANFRPKFDVQSLDKTQVADAIENWLQDTKRIASVELKQLFNLVTNMSTIQHIKLKANELRRELELSSLIEYFNLKHSLDFYESEYVPLINQRVRDIIENSWKEVVLTTFQTVEQALENEALSEHNIWLEQPSDLPASLEIALSEDCKLKNLLMKTKGYDSEVLKICIGFDNKIGEIIAEMNVLLEEHAAKAEDKLKLIEFLQQTSQQQLNEFLTKLKNLNLGNEQRKQLLLIVRVCVAIVELCPNLKICFCQQANWRQWISCSNQHTTASLEHWQRICLLIEEEAHRFWAQILDGILTEHNCESQLPTTLTHEVLLEDLVLWETITLDQKDEHDNAITSSFRIPSQPLISLQTYLFNIIHTINTAVPQTLPSKVLQTFNEKLLTQFLRHYKNLSLENSLSTNQSLALQLYFDLKFLQTLFHVSREQRSLSEEFQMLQNTFRDFVDPFDFELFADYITQNVKRSVLRLSCEFGVLLPIETHLSGSSTVTTTLSQEKDPNVLSLSTNASTSIWFPLLPIVTGHASTNRGGEKQLTTTTTVTSTSTTPSRKSSSRKGDSESNPKSKSSATSFLANMEWFR